jgi:hypothetical protein
LPGFEIIGEVSQIETIATASGIREVGRLRKLLGWIAGENAKASHKSG